MMLIGVASMCTMPAAASTHTPHGPALSIALHSHAAQSARMRRTGDSSQRWVTPDPAACTAPPTHPATPREHTLPGAAAPSFWHLHPAPRLGQISFKRDCPPKSKRSERPQACDILSFARRRPRPRLSLYFSQVLSLESRPLSLRLCFRPGWRLMRACQTPARTWPSWPTPSRRGRSCKNW